MSNFQWDASKGLLKFVLKVRLQPALVGLLWLGGTATTAAVDLAPPIVNDPIRPSQRPLESPSLRPRQPGEALPLPPPPPAALGGSKERNLILRQVEFIGNTAISTAELQALAANFLNRPVSGSDLEELRQQITQRYINAGYINSGATIPSQSVVQGTLLIKIVEGTLTEIRLNGMGRLKEDYIKDRLLLGAGSPPNIKSLQESYLLLLRDPLIAQLNGRFLPGLHPGESVLDINVTRARPYQFYVTADNYITPTVGGFAGRVGGWVSNLSTFGETIDANVVVAEGMVGVNTGLDIPINAYDTRLNFRFTDNNTKLVEKPLDKFQIKSHITSYDGGISQPIYRSLEHELKVGANISHRQDKSEFLGDPTAFLQGGIELTVLRLWQQYHYQDKDKALAVRSTFSQGLHATKSDPVDSSLLPPGNFFSWVGQAQYTQVVMDNGARFIWRGAAQFTDGPIWNLERFAIGGAYSVRGYRENSYVRDNGVYTGVEFRYPLFGGEFLAPHSFYLVPFMDYGGAWNNPGNDSYSPTNMNNLYSVGLGFNWHYQQLDVDFYWAHSLIKAPPLVVNNQSHAPLEGSVQDDGVHFRVNLNAF